jgi:hypothetical protein
MPESDTGKYFLLPANLTPETKCISITVPDDVEHLRIIRGLFYQLGVWASWQRDEDESGRIIAQYYRNLNAENFPQWDESGCIPPEVGTPDKNSGCIQFPPNSSIISYAPQDPFTQPGYIPPGYIAVPFIAVTEDDIISLFPGVQIGDVVSGWLSIPVLTPGIGQGLARFRVTIEGAGMVELHLLRFPGAGAALITNDDDPLTVRTINLNKDIVQLPAETVGVVVVEVPIETPGTHHIDVTFMPRFNDEILFFGYGGGLRGVNLCGFDETIDEILKEKTNVGQIVLEDALSQQIRLKPEDNCIIQLWCIDHWEDWYNPLTCAAGAIEQPTDGDNIEPGECRQWSVSLRANEKWLLPAPVSEGDTIQISGATGAWNDGSAGWNCISGQVYILGACGADDAADAGDPLQTVNHMRLVANVDGSWYDAYNQTIAVGAGVTDGKVYLQANDDSLSDNSGSVSFTVRYCRAADIPSTISVTYDYGTGVAVLTPFDADEWIINVNSEQDPSGQAIRMTFSEPVKLTILQVPGWSLNTSTPSLFSHLGLGGSPVEQLSYPTNNTPLQHVMGQTVDNWQCDDGQGNPAATNWTAQLKIERV